MGVLVYSFTLLVAYYLVKKLLLLFETTRARDKFQHCNERVMLRFVHANACRMFLFFDRNRSSTMYMDRKNNHNVIRFGFCIAISFS